MSPEQQALIDFFAAYDEALNRHPHLLLDMGYNRVADWCLVIHDATGVGIRNAAEVIRIEGATREEMLRVATAKLHELFLS